MPAEGFHNGAAPSARGGGVWRPQFCFIMLGNGRGGLNPPRSGTGDRGLAGLRVIGIRVVAPLPGVGPPEG